MVEEGGMSRFRPRARIMRTLGEELISSDSVALIELVKNAYDADASEVFITFTAPLEQGFGGIEVVDNGKGMSLEVVRRAWMEPATPSKVKENTTVSGRRVLGEKGIGRFAASRLASNLQLISRQKNSLQEVCAVFDWRQFDDDDKYLDEVVIPIESRPAKSIQKNGEVDFLSLNESAQMDTPSTYHGTILRMTMLKSKWGASGFEEVQRGLSRLVSPFAEYSRFKINIKAPVGFEHYSSEIRPPDIIKYPHYSVTGEVAADGTFSLRYEALATGLVEPFKGAFVVHPKAGWIMQEGAENFIDDEGYIPPACGPLSIQLRVWDRDELGNVQQKLGGTISSVRKDLDNFAGINIYRDGFRVMPYGEPKNDWLRLDLRRVQKPTYKLSNNQIVGYISISADKNGGLKDQSNREGLREGAAYTDLHDVMICILSKMEEFRHRVRKKDEDKGKDKNKNVRQGGLFDLPDLEGIREHLSKQHPLDSHAKHLVDDIETEFVGRMENIKAVVARYSGLATLGKLVDAVLHEGRQPLAMISSQASLGKEDLEDYGHGEEPKIRSLDGRFQKIKGQAGALSLIFKRIEPFGGRRSGRPSKLYVEKIIQDAFDIFETQLLDASVDYEISNTETLVSVDPYELQQVFVNLIENSIYWLHLVSASERKILVRVGRTSEGYVEIVFSDSGPGIPASERDSIFDAYYSTRDSGAGLGLSIVGEIVSNYYDGALELLDGGELSGASFRIVLRKRV
jgi:signal transduction histidine kinase